MKARWSNARPRDTPIKILSFQFGMKLKQKDVYLTQSLKLKYSSQTMQNYSDKTPVAVRKWLKDALEDWQQEGVIEPRQADALRQRYTLSNIETETTNAFLMTAYTIGALILGAGVISFVAANWEWLNAGVKVALLLLAMLTAHGVGYYLWKIDGRWERLGHGFILLGTIIFAANLGLIAQIFNIRSNWYNGFGVAAIGAVAIAWSIRSVPNAVWAEIMGFVWAFGYMVDGHNGVPFYPYLALLIFIPLAISTQSVWVLVLSLISYGFFVLLDIGMHSESVRWVFLGVFVCCLAFFGLAWASKRRSQTAFIFVPALVLSVLGIISAVYWLSFHDIAESLVHDMFKQSANTHLSETFLHIGAASLVFIGGAFLYLKGQTEANSPRNEQENARDRGLFWSFMAAGLAGLALFVPNAPFLMILMNVVAIGLTFLLLRAGISSQSRAPFWAGSLLGVLIIVSRFFEYTENLLLKSLVFILCGIILIFATIQFEKSIKRKDKMDAEAKA